MGFYAVSALLLAACTGGSPKPDGAVGDSAGGEPDTAVDTAPLDTDTGPVDTGPVDTGPVDTGCAPLTWFGDADGDGYGADARTIEACEAPAGTVATGGDCDDRRADVNPGIVEACGADLDVDCDGVTPACALLGDLDLDDADARVDGLTFDGEGYPLGGAGDVDGDGRDDFVAVGTDVDGVTGAWIFAGLPGAVGTADAFAVVAATEPGPFFAPSLAPVGDVTATGAPTLAIGTEGALGLWETPLAAGVLGEPDVVILDDLPSYDSLSGPQDFVGPGDMNGDGYRDLALSARDNSSYGDAEEATWIFHGPFDTDRALQSPDARIIETLGGGRTDIDQLAALGDQDGDGLGDLALLSVNVAVYVHAGDATGDIHRRNDAIATIEGALGARRLARGTADVDGDGYADLAVGCDAGELRVLRGPLVGTSALSDAWAVITVDATGDLMSLEGVGDTDGDGAGDLLVGAGAGWADPAARLFTGLGPGAYTTADATATIRGGGGLETGYRAASAGDHDGDGLQDLLVGAGEPGWYTIEQVGLFFGG